MKTDLITGLISLAFSAAYLYEASSIKIFGGAGTAGVNAQTVPYLWGGCLAVLSVILILRSLLAKKKGEKESSSGRTRREFLEKIKARREVVYTFGLLIGYAILMKPIGFIPTSMIYLLLQIWVLTPIEKRSRKVLVTAAGLAVFFSVSLYFLFTEYLMVMLPAGILR